MEWNTFTSGTMMGQILTRFLFVITGGYANLSGSVWTFFTALATIELVVCGLLWAFSEYAVIEHLVWKILSISVVAWFLGNWRWLIDTCMTGFVRAGLVAAGQSVTWSPTDFMDPGNIADFGWSAVAVVFAEIDRHTGMEALKYLPFTITAGLAAWVVVLAFMLIAIQVGMAIVEFYLVSVLALFLFPFTLFRHTAFLGQGVFSMIGTHAVKLMVLAFVTGIILPVMYGMQLPLEPSFRHVGIFMFGALLCLVFVWHAPALASGLVYGHPALHAGHATNMAASSMATLAAVTSGVGGLAQGALQAGRRGISGASSLATAAQLGAAQMRPASGLGRAVSTVAGGARGIGAYTRQSLTHGFREAVASGRIRAEARLAPPPGPTPGHP